LGADLVSSEDARNEGTAPTDLGRLLWLATNRWQSALRRALAPLGLTQTQALVLACALQLAPGFSQTALARVSGVDVTVVSPTVRKLVKAGYLEREAGRDERTWAVRLTAPGQAIARSAQQSLRHTDEVFFARFGRDHHALHLVLSTLSGRTVRIRAAASPGGG